MLKSCFAKPNQDFESEDSAPRFAMIIVYIVLTKNTDDTDDTCFALFVACVLGSLVYEFADSHRACNLCVVNEFKFYSYMFNGAAAQGKNRRKARKTRGP